MNHDDDAKIQSEREKDIQLQRERRRQRAIERLGSDSPRCLRCPESDPIVLERHHLAGKAYDPHSTVILCRNCHRKVSDLQKDHPPKISDPSDPLEIIGHFLLGLADLFEVLLTQLREFAEQLIRRADENAGNLPCEA